jgi:type I restriction enzyme, S subunit
MTVDKPVDARELELGSLCISVLDCSHSTPVWTESGVLVLRSYNIKNGKLDLSSSSFTDEFHYLDRTRRATPTFGDLVITREAPMGEVCMIPKGLKCCLGQRMVLLRPNTEKVEPNFLLYGLQSETVQRAIHVTGGTGSTVSNLRIPVLKSLKLLVPSLRGQRAIATALSDVDALLAKIDQLIAKKRDLKQAAMQQLLTGQTRLPGFSGEWVSRLLRHFVLDFIVPMRDKPTRLDGKTPWCRIEDFEGTYLFESKSGQGVDDSSIQAMGLKVYPVGTLLVSCSADLGRCAIVGRPLVSNQTFIGLHFNSSIASSVFFYFYMMSMAARLNLISSGTTISYLSREQFESFPVKVPGDIAEQTAIATVLTDMDTELAALEVRRDKTRALKQGMMQALLTGRIRLAGGN